MAAFYEIVIEADETESGEKGFLVTVPDFPEITTDGGDIHNALNNAGRAIEEAIAGRMVHGEDIPAPVRETKKGSHYVEVPILVVMKGSLYVICKAKNITRAELSRRLNWHREQVERLFRLDHDSRIDQLEAAFKAVHAPLTMSMPDHEIMVA